MTATPQLFQQDDLQKAHDYLQAMLATRMNNYWLTFSQQKDLKANVTITAQIAYTTKAGERKTLSVDGRNMADLCKQVSDRL